MEGLEFGVSLKDNMSGPAHEAAKSLHELKGGAHEAKSVIDELAHGFIKTVEPAEVLKDAFKDVKAGIGEMISGIKSGEAKEVISGLTESMAGMAQMLDLVIPGLGQLAAAAIRVGGAIASLTVGIIQSAVEMSIEATQAKEAMISMFGALSGSRAEGAKLEEMLGDLSEQIGITKDTLAPFTKSFMAMGVEGEDALRKMTLAAVSAQAIMGDPAAANAFQTLEKKIQLAVQTGQQLKIPAKGLKSLADMGLTVNDVASKMGVSSKTLAAQLKAGTVDAKKFGEALQDALVEKGAGPLQRMSASFGNLRKMMSQSIEDMFEDMGKDVDPFMASIKDLFSIFSQSKPSGQAMKAGIGGAMHTVFEVLQKGVLPIKHFFLDLVIWSLQTYIVVKKHWTSVRPIMQAFGWAVLVSAKAMAHLAHGVFTAVQRVVLLIAAIREGITSVMNFAESAYKAGSDFIDGFVNGIKAGASKVVAAAQDMGAAAKQGVKDFLGISSPSKVMFQLGGNTGAGLAGGMQSASDQVTRAGSALGDAAVAGTISPRSDDSARAGSAASVGQIVINITAPDGVTDAKALTEVSIAAIFERLQLQQGLG